MIHDSYQSPYAYTDAFRTRKTSGDVKRVQLKYDEQLFFLTVPENNADAKHPAIYTIHGTGANSPRSMIAFLPDAGVLQGALTSLDLTDQMLPFTDDAGDTTMLGPDDGIAEFKVIAQPEPPISEFDVEYNGV